jgi:hypothetical protein
LRARHHSVRFPCDAREDLLHRAAVWSHYDH